LGKADLHLHTDWGDGLASVAEILDYVENQTDLDVIAVSDHDDLRGALQARELAARRHYRFEVIVGMEVTTLSGHLLIYDIEKPLPSLRSLEKTLALAHERGGLCVVPHPMSWLIRSVGQRDLMRVMRHNREGVHFDGIEVLNPSLAGRVTHRKTLEMNRSTLHLPEFGGSDAHILGLVGSGYTEFEGRTADDFRRALKAKSTAYGGHFWNQDEQRQLVRAAPQQVYRAWVVLPGRHISRLVRSRLVR